MFARRISSSTRSVTSASSSTPELLSAWAVSPSHLPPEHEPDLPEGLPRLREDPHVALALRDRVRSVVLRGELDLAEDRKAFQQTRPHDVYEMLDRAAVEFVEGLLERATNEPARDPAGALRVVVAPVRVHADGERPVGELRQSRVLIPRERHERAARRLEQAHPQDPASPGGRDDRVATTLEVSLRHRDVAARESEHHVTLVTRPHRLRR